MMASRAAKLRRLTVLLLVLLAAAMLWPGDASRDGPALRTQPISTGDIVDTVEAIGTLNPMQVVTVGTQVSGKVSKLHVDYNDAVTEGELLAEIDPALLKTQLTQSEASLRNAENNFELVQRNAARMRRLYEQDYVSRAEWERADLEHKTARSNVESARAKMESDRVNLSYATIRSPVAGVIIAREVTEGQTVAASLQAPTLFKIAQDLSQMKIEINLSEADVGRVQVNQPVTFSVDAFPDRTFSGVISKVLLNPNTQQNIVTYTVMVKVDNPEKLLLPGMTAYVRIVIHEKKGVLRVPNAAFRFTPRPEGPSAIKSLLTGQGRRPPMPLDNRPKPQDPKGRILYVVRNDVPVPVEIIPGVTDGRQTEVTSSEVKEGDTVAVGYAVDAE